LVFCAENAPDRHAVAIDTHGAFLTVEDMEELVQWFRDHGKVPGVFLVA
jgi:hypothetical protein